MLKSLIYRRSGDLRYSRLESLRYETESFPARDARSKTISRIPQPLITPPDPGARVPSRRARKYSTYLSRSGVNK